MSRKRSGHRAGGGPFTDALWQALSAIPASRPRSPGLPLPGVTPPEPADTTYHNITTIDDRGRLGNRSAVTFLRWEPGRRVDLSAVPGAVLVVARHDGHHAVTRQGHLRLPLPIRRRYRLNRGDRVLLVACPGRDLLIAYPMPSLNAMILAYHGARTGGNPR